MANDVPKYFADFVKQNADEHGQLAARTESVRGDLTSEIAKAETRLTRWTAVLVIGGLTIAVSILTFAMTIIVD